MKSDLEMVNKFDAYIKKSLKNELKSFAREMKSRQKKYINFSELSKSDEDKLCYKDEYPSDNFEEKITTQFFDAIVHDELLYEALLSIKPRSRELIILKYWGEMTDVEVGKHLNMTKASVNKQKLRALEKLRKIIEEMNEHDT